jgi:hypothetical protein
MFFYKGISKAKQINDSFIYELLGNSPASEFYILTFRNTLSIPSSLGDRYQEWLGLKMLEYLYGKSLTRKYLSAYKDGTDRVFRKVSI